MVPVVTMIKAMTMLNTAAPANPSRSILLRLRERTPTMHHTHMYHRLLPTIYTHMYHRASFPVTILQNYCVHVCVTKDASDVTSRHVYKVEFEFT